MSFTTKSIQHTITEIKQVIDPIGAELNELDGRLGDGDLGVTMINGFANMGRITDDMPEDVGQALFAAAKAMTAVSGSSFGTLMATALMAAGKSVKGRDAVEWSEIPKLLQLAQDAMISRGGASLGDKTVLDSLEAVIKATTGMSDPESMQKAASIAAKEALAEFIDKPNKIGRARVYADKSIGLEDPGMVAMCRLIDAIPAK
ncbi:dihydroxyacetone kinase subunit L [Marinomonas sp. 15G1-11]|uniref:Dihydroxyacetone kinase subunit L n=1 Tax=Marinomonas phaeophyticola TaxID=3004091 RepID=A0ABT4JWH9_9GAMM|nr:dihydroxyacetone kinase subunit L [Marinomonas sp. 15G1-11]MCZ2721919.1 dihydroxyacetone kinase subunit L [Marinomonas sp. 15G1-11]